MSVLFGRWNVDGQAVTQEYDEIVAKLLTPYGPDGAAAYAKGPIPSATMRLTLQDRLIGRSAPHPTVGGDPDLGWPPR